MRRIRLNVKITAKGVRPYLKPGVVIFLTLISVLALFGDALAVVLPTLKVGLENTSEPSKVATALEIIFFLTILSIAPAILLMTTSFTRLIVVFGFLRQAIGTQQMPPNQVLLGWPCS